MIGWDQMRARISGSAEGPMLAAFSARLDFLRIAPVLQNDPMKP
jgi:hypothetical protein